MTPIFVERIELPLSKHEDAGGDAKVIHFIRHAEGHHNVAGRADPAYGYLREDLEDAEITLRGREQCEALGSKAEAVLIDHAQLMLVSPMRRTIQTALASFPSLSNRIPVVALEAIREQTGLHPCDRRLSVSELTKQFPTVDFSSVTSDADPMYHLYTAREPADDVIRRASEFLAFLANRLERDIVVVTHSAFLRVLFKNVLLANEEFEEFENCEMRSFRVLFSA